MASLKYYLESWNPSQSQKTPLDSFWEEKWPTPQAVAQELSLSLWWLGFDSWLWEWVLSGLIFMWLLPLTDSFPLPGQLPMSYLELSIPWATIVVILDLEKTVYCFLGDNSCNHGQVITLRLNWFPVGGYLW